MFHFPLEFLFITNVPFDSHHLHISTTFPVHEVVSLCFVFTSLVAVHSHCWIRFWLLMCLICQRVLHSHNILSKDGFGQCGGSRSWVKLLPPAIAFYSPFILNKHLCGFHLYISWFGFWRALYVYTDVCPLKWLHESLWSLNKRIYNFGHAGKKSYITHSIFLNLLQIHSNTQVCAHC